MTTPSELTDRLEILLNDETNATWTVPDLQEFLNNAMRDYSIQFPRTVSTTINCVADQQTYDLPSDCIGLLLVAYPGADDPPTYLERRARTHDAFWDYEGYYDVQYSGTGEGDSPTTRGTLYISQAPAAGETINIAYSATHNTDLKDIEHITVPDEHEHLLLLFAVWQASLERLATEQQNPDMTTNLINSLSRATEHNEQAYRRSLKAAHDARNISGLSGPWKSDIHDPIY